MTDAQIIAGDLQANIAERVVSGLLLPYGEVGRTNLGRFEVEPHKITIPQDVSVLMANEEHSQTEPRASFLTAIDTEAGIVASFRVGKNPEGDRLLAKIEKRRAEGKPMALSAEVKGIIIKAGKAVGGLLTGAAFTERGAFPSATLLASDTEGVSHYETEYTDAEGKTWRLVQDSETTTEETDTGSTTTTVTTVTEEISEADAEEETEEEEADVADASTTLQAKAAPPKRSAPKAPSLREVLAIMEARRAGTATDVMLARLDGQFAPKGSEATLFAALSDIKYDAVGSPVPYENVPQWVGELYDGVEYEQLVAPLISHKDLTAKTVAGFKWTTKPAGGTWAGNKSNIPSNSPATEPYSETAELYAGGHDHAIEHKLFNTPGYFEGYWQMMVEDYKRWVDDQVLATLLAEATEVEADNPAGLTIGAAMSALIDGAAAVVTAHAIPTFALLDVAGWKTIMKTPQNAVLGYLDAALGLDKGTLADSGFVIRPHAEIDPGHVLVGARPAATLRELPGTPVRVEAPDTVKGGIDTNMFGAALTEVHMAGAFQLVTPYTP
jgi:hypothetical protein